MGLVVCVGEIVGGTGMPLVGKIADATSLAAPMLMQIGCAVVGGLLSLFLIETAPAVVARRSAAAAAQVSAS